MGLKIKTKDGKLILPLCTMAGNSPYNKGGATVRVEQDKIVEIYNYKGGHIAILRPVIDKLIFEYRFKDCGAHKRDIQKEVLENAEAAAKKMPEMFKLATESSVGVQRLYYLNKSHERNFVLLYKPTKAKIIIQLKSHKEGGAFFRCELNPARLGPAGMEFFRQFIQLLTANDWQKITFERMAKATKAIKRIDIAVDMLGVDASDLEGRYVYKNKQLKKKPVQNTTGRVETMYFQMPENDKNQAYWYNKTVQLKETAKDPVDGGSPSPYGEALYTRFEYRINETDKPIAKLHSFLNHLPKVHFRAVDYSKIKGKDYTHPLFLRYAVTRTRDKALEMIPNHLKDEYAASYDAAMLDIWKPEMIWERGWHSELISLGLLDPATLKKKKSKKNKA